MFNIKYIIIKEMCDAPGALTGYFTSVDMQNAQKYARMKILYEQSQQYKDKLKWVDSNSDGSPNYYCPPGLTDCKDGYIVFANKTECQSISNLQQFRDDSNPEENADNGYYLEWRTNDNKIDPNSKKAETTGQCYRASGKFRLQCEQGNFADDKKYPVEGLYYDNNTGRCFITQKYCKHTGDLKYNPPANNIPSYISSMKYCDNQGNCDDYGYGGSCDMNGGQKFADFLFGETVAKGVFGGKCFK